MIKNGEKNILQKGLGVGKTVYEKSKESLQGVSKITQKKLPKVHAYARKNKKRLRWIIPAVLIVLFLIFKPKGVDPSSITVAPVETKNLVSTVKASGKITATVDLELSFKKSDTVDAVNVEVGQKVSKGQILATLKNQNELGALNQARGNLARVLEGATSSEEKVAEVALENARLDLENVKRQQNTLVENARRTLFSSGLEATPTVSGYNLSIKNPIVSGSYTGSIEGRYIISLYPTGSGYHYSVSGLGSGDGEISTTGSASIGKGLFISFPYGFEITSNTTWNIDVPNIEGSAYTTNLNAYANAQTNAQSIIAQAESLVRQREAELALKRAAPRSGDVLSAQGQLQSALGVYENTIIRAPASGTVTKVGIKVGEQAKALEPVIVVQDVSKLYVETNVNESDITQIRSEQPVLFTIDAFGASRSFTGFVTQVDLAATVKDGIVNYKVQNSLEGSDPAIRPGMNANIVITTGTKENVIAIPGAAITKKDGKSYVNIITDEKKKKYKEQEVVVGIKGDGNLVEVVSGLSVGDKIALIEVKK